MLAVCPSLALLTISALLPTTPPTCNIDPSLARRADRGAPVASMARVYADVNQNMPRTYWDYDSVNIGEPLPARPRLALLRRFPRLRNPCVATCADFCRRLGPPGEL